MVAFRKVKRLKLKCTQYSCGALNHYPKVSKSNRVYVELVKRKWMSVCEWENTIKFQHQNDKLILSLNVVEK